MTSKTSFIKNLSPKNNFNISKSLSSKNFFNNYNLNINDSNDIFEKTSNLKSLNTYGIPAELIYKKTPTTRKNIEYQFNFKENFNNFVSDGGLNKKINKFNEDPTFYNKNNLIKSSSTSNKNYYNNFINNNNNFINNNNNNFNNNNNENWGLGIGDWAQSPIPNPQSPIPNPQFFIII